MSWKEKLVDELIDKGILQIEEPAMESTDQAIGTGKGMGPCGRGMGPGPGMGLGRGMSPGKGGAEPGKGKLGPNCPYLDEDKETTELIEEQITPEEKEKGSFVSKKIEVEIRDGKEKAIVEVNDNGNIMEKEFDTVQDALSFFNMPKERDQIQNTEEKVEMLEEPEESEETEEVEEPAEEDESPEEPEEAIELEGDYNDSNSVA